MEKVNDTVREVCGKIRKTEEEERKETERKGYE